jgi:hypothetical protein
MRRILQILIAIVLTGCSVSKYYTSSVEHFDSRAEGNGFIDSLRTSGKDTIIGYYDGCSGCIRGLEKPYYIYWQSENKWNLTKFTIYARFNHITGFSPPIKYISDNIEAIDTLKLSLPKAEMSHFTYDAVRILLNGREINYEIKNYEKWNNESAPKVILIDKIRSKLFAIFPSEWKALDYKF